MLTLKFKMAPVQDRDDSVLFNLICEDVPAGMEQDIAFEFTGTNVTVTPAKLALKDIFDPATKGAVADVRGQFLGAGDASVVMSASCKGAPMGTVTRPFKVS